MNENNNHENTSGNIAKRLDLQDDLLQRIYISVEKTRRYFLFTMIATLVTFVLPLIAMLFVLPWFLKAYLPTLGGI